MHMEGLAAARDGEGSIAHCMFPRTVLFVFRCGQELVSYIERGIVTIRVL